MILRSVLPCSVEMTASPPRARLDTIAQLSVGAERAAPAELSADQVGLEARGAGCTAGDCTVPGPPGAVTQPSRSLQWIHTGYTSMWIYTGYMWIHIIY